MGGNQQEGVKQAPPIRFGQILAHAVQLMGVATTASLVTLSAAALTWLIVPRMAVAALSDGEATRKVHGSDHPLTLSIGEQHRP
jgi:hypothetical protein